MTLQDHLFLTRRFLRDSLANFWPDPDLIVYINKARQNVVRDTCCARSLGIIQTVTGQESYSFQTVLSAVQANGAPAQQILTVMGITIQWSAPSGQSPTLRYKLDWKPWTQLDAQLRLFISYQYIPSVWSMYDYQSFYVAPIPNNAYNLEVDSVYAPNDLVNYTDPENAIPMPFQDCLVALKAARWAKYYEQSFAEASAFDQQYELEKNRIAGITPCFRVPSFYGQQI
jgi:hypothetical protein